MGALFSAIGDLIYVFCKVLATILELLGKIIESSKSSNSNYYAYDTTTKHNTHTLPQLSNRSPSNYPSNDNNSVPMLGAATKADGLFEIYTAQNDRRIWVVSIDRMDRVNNNNSYLKTRVKIYSNKDRSEKYYNYEFKIVNDIWTYHTASGAWTPVAEAATANLILRGVCQYIARSNIC